MNFYLKNLRNGEIEHIGKFVRGWCFMLNHDTFWNERTQSYDLLKMHSDRYHVMCEGKRVTSVAVLSLIKNNYALSTPIHEDAIPGPRRLSRRRIGSKINPTATCIAHPADLQEGYDIIKGDFQL